MSSRLFEEVFKKCKLQELIKKDNIIFKTGLKPFKYKEITSFEQFFESLEYIVSQIECISELVNYIKLDQCIQTVLHESIDNYKRASDKISIHESNVCRVKQSIDRFFDTDPVYDNRGNQLVLDERGCNNLRDQVNDETNIVNSVIQNYYRSEKNSGVDFPKPLSTSCSLYNNAVDVFNHSLEMFTKTISIKIDPAQKVVYYN